MGGSSVHGILQAKILEWIAISPPGYLPYPGTELEPPVFPALQAYSLPTEPSIKLRTILLKLKFKLLLFSKEGWGVTGCCKILDARTLCSCSYPQRSSYNVPVNLQ